MPLSNAYNEAFATLFIGTPLATLKAETNAVFQNIIIASFVGLVMATLILYFVIQSGINNVHKLIESINAVIAEHTKGNVDCGLDSQVFTGDFRTLANSIVKLSNQGMKDPLTGLPNRRAFDSRLEMEWNRAMREKTLLSILIVDVDKFKMYNDEYGHQQGDIVLQTIAEAMTLPIQRAIDFVARWGGEEFVVLLPHTDLNGAVLVAEKIRQTIENTEVPSSGSNYGVAKKVTVSIGVNTLIPTAEKNISKFISHADAALYCAKEAGRNRVCQYEGQENVS
jgi:diguanylate cyclase (GGDEF)-like protein